MKEPSSQYSADCNIEQQVLLGNNPQNSTGFIYDNDGHIITNYHVVKNENPINVTFADGNSYPTQITGTDPYSDLAVLQASAALKKEQMKPLPIRNSSQIGENVGADTLFTCG